jgi:predicted nicotinamide N-methyase
MRRVLDLGSGSGLVGIAAALAGAASINCAELDPIARVAIALNGRHNGVRLESIPVDILADDPHSWDVVLVGDLFYEVDMSSRVLRFLACQAEHGVTILAGDPGRQFFPRSRFRKLAGYDVPVMPEVEDGPVKPVGVWALGGAVAASPPVQAREEPALLRNHDECETASGKTPSVCGERIGNG